MYIYPKFSGYDFGYFRILGDGLGNLLFPWARAVCISKRTNLRVIAPTWPQFKLGPVFRNEPDKRFYLDLFNHSERYVTGGKKIMALARLTKVTEGQLLSGRCNMDLPFVAYIIGMDGFFTPILDEYEFVRRELLAITKTKHKIGLKISEGVISVHVRLGDFKQVVEGASTNYGSYNTQQPIRWYKQMIMLLRKELGHDYPVIIWSDDAGDRLTELTDLNNTRREFLGSSVADLIGMSSARVLIASGSSFSMWASYLGRMPVIWYPGQLRQKLYNREPCAEIEVSEEAMNLPLSFISLL